MTRALLYARLSLDRDQDKTSVKTQLSEGHSLAAARGATVVGVFVDGSRSAARAENRPDFKRLMAAMENGEGDVSIFREWSRISRNRRDDLTFIETSEHHCPLVWLTRGLDLDLRTPLGQMMADQMSMMARGENREKASRRIEANGYRAAHGLPPSGVPPLGFEKDRRTIREEEAELVRSMFADFAAGESLRAISTRLQEDGAPTRHGRPWNPSTVRSILLNPRYAGHNVYRGQITEVPAASGPLVDPEQFSIVQGMLADPRRRTAYSTARRHLGSGIYRCGVCDSPVRAWSGNRYRCPEGCVNRTGAAIDALVVQFVEAYLARPDLKTLLAQSTDPGEMRTLMAESERLTARLRRIGDDYDADLIDGHRYREAREKALAELDRVQQAQARIAATTGPDAILTAPDPVAAFRDSTLAPRRRVVNTLVKVVLHRAPRGRKVFDENTVTISWR